MARAGEMVYKVNEGAPGIYGVNQRRGFVGLAPVVAVAAAWQVGESFPKCGAYLFLCGHHGSESKGACVNDAVLVFFKKAAQVGVIE